MEERKFLHDLSNPLAIGYGNIRIAFKKLEAISEDAEAPANQVVDRLKKAIDAFERVNEILEIRKKAITTE